MNLATVRSLMSVRPAVRPGSVEGLGSGAKVSVAPLSLLLVPVVQTRIFVAHLGTLVQVRIESNIFCSESCNGRTLMRNSARILVVDDYEQFRHYLRRKLQSRPKFQIIGEAVDGVQAVQAGEELHPDLVLINIGMPRLNGIDAAHQISRLVSGTTILFVSQESYSDVVAEVAAQRDMFKSRTQRRSYGLR